MNDDYFIMKGYTCNLDGTGQAVPFQDDPVSASLYQVKVYAYARKVIRRHRLTSVLDIGCGCGIKLKEVILPVCSDITGIDRIHAVSFCKKEHGFGRWLMDDLENPVFPCRDRFDLILASDVIEHLADPDHLSAYIKKHSHPETHIVISTPERDRVHGKNHAGPPVNLTHVREWNRKELNAYIRSRGFFIEKHFPVGEKSRRPLETIKQMMMLRPLRKIQVVHCRPHIDGCDPGKTR